MEARLESTYRPQIQWQKIKEQRAVGLRRQRDHLPFLILPGMVVNPLQVGGLSAQTWTVIHQLAVNFARRKIDERHVLSVRLGQKLTTRAEGKPIFSQGTVACSILNSHFP